MPLVPQAIEVLESRAKDHAGDFVFPSESTEGYLGRIKKSWTKLLERAGIDHCTPHDLRRTVAQACLDAGGDPAFVKALLGHSNPMGGITGVYARPSLERQRAALEAGVNRLIGKVAGDTVVPFTQTG